MDVPRAIPRKAIEYPTRDGRPMGETDDHRNEMNDHAIHVLKDFFEGQPLVYVSGNNFLYFTEGVPSDVVCPDAYVVRGVSDRQRDTYKVWEEGGHVPCFVLEVTSKTTRLEDLGEKMAKYRDDLAVQEYFLFDLRGEWIPERLRGYVLEGGVYRPVDRSASGRLPSQCLGLELQVMDRHLRFFLPGTDAPLPTRKERAERAEAEARRLRAELARLRENEGGGAPPSAPK